MAVTDADLRRGSRAADLAVHFHNLALRILDARGIEATLSRASFFDVADRYLVDAERFSAEEPDGVRPSKHVGYIAFWIRKLKPLSNAVVDTESEKDAAHSGLKEIVDINEQMAIWMAFEQLRDFAQAQEIEVHDGASGTDYKLIYTERLFRICVDRFCEQKVDVNGSNMFDRLVRDLRYRTFGPHHLVHIFDQFVFSMFVEGRKRRRLVIA
ncbi:hypothetical protein [Azospirillum sp. sgz302134]